MFESVVRQYRPTLSWWLGVAVFSVAPLTVALVLQDIGHILVSMAPGTGESISRVALGVLFLPVIVPMQAAEALGLGGRSTLLAFLTWQLLLAVGTTWMIRRLQARRFRRALGSL